MRIYMVLALIVVACTRDPKTAAYEEAARRVNPIFLALQPTRERLRLAHPPKDDSQFYDEHPAVVADAIATCNDARTLFAELGLVDFWRRSETSRLGDFSLALAARELASSPKSCLSRLSHGDRNHSHYLCWYVCYATWDFLAQEAEHLRRCAREVGVEIVSLGATDAPHKRCPRFSE